MARRRYSRRRRYRRSWLDKIDFNPEIKRGVLAIFLFVLAGLSILSFFDLAGLAGSFWEAFLSIGFGNTRYVLPIVLITIGYLIEKEGEYDYTITHFVGVILFFLALNGLFHLWFPTDMLLDEAVLGHGGGMAGLVLAWPLKQFFGHWAALTTLIALLVIALLFLFNTSLARLVEAHRVFFAHLGWLGRTILTLTRGSKYSRNTYGTEEEENVPFERRPLSDEDDEDIDFENDENDEETEPKMKTAKTGARPVRPQKKHRVAFNLPPVSLLYTLKSKPTAGDIKANGAIIKETLENFGMPVALGEVQVGPTVTQFTIKPDKGIKLNRITALHNDLALALAAHPIRIEAPIPGKSLVGIEVPNQRVAMVTLRELLEDKKFKKSQNKLTFTVGKDVSGAVHFGDLTTMPHLLVAGATGTGKTVGINSLIVSLLYQHTPDTLRFVMVDPKRVELPAYNGIPHLLTPVITDKKKTLGAIKWLITEMERRFDLFSQNGSKDIASYNKKKREPIPFIVFVIDELADLMATAGAEIEGGIVRLAQMARATGIHMVIATQRPSVDVITGLMKANIPARVAFSVASIVDSRTILDNAGAEKLLGRGDMLFLTADLSKPRRLQGAYISEEEIRRVVDFLKDQDAPDYETFEGSGGGESITAFEDVSDEHDSLFEEARQMVIETKKASASYLQRRLRIGYARAARILDELEAADVVGPAVGSKPREVLMTPQDLDMIDSGSEKEDDFLQSVAETTEDEPDDGEEYEEDEEDYEDEDETEETEEKEEEEYEELSDEDKYWDEEEEEKK